MSLGEPENRVVPIIAWRFQSRKIKEHLGDGDGYQIVRTRPGVYNLTWSNSAARPDRQSSLSRQCFKSSRCTPLHHEGLNVAARTGQLHFGVQQEQNMYTCVSQPTGAILGRWDKFSWAETSSIDGNIGRISVLLIGWTTWPDEWTSFADYWTGSFFCFTCFVWQGRTANLDWKQRHPKNPNI